MLHAGRAPLRWIEGQPSTTRRAWSPSGPLKILFSKTGFTLSEHLEQFFSKIGKTELVLYITYVLIRIFKYIYIYGFWMIFSMVKTSPGSSAKSRRWSTAGRLVAMVATRHGWAVTSRRRHGWANEFQCLLWELAEKNHVMTSWNCFFGQIFCKLLCSEVTFGSGLGSVRLLGRSWQMAMTLPVDRPETACPKAGSAGARNARAPELPGIHFTLGLHWQGGKSF